VRRRTFIAAGAASAAALAAPRLAVAAPKGDAGLIYAVADAEWKLLGVVDASLGDSSLSPDHVRLISRIREHEVDHSAALDTFLEALGSEKPRPAAPPGSGLGAIAGHKRAVLAAQRAAARELIDAKLLQSIATMAGCEGQHLVAIERALEA